MAMRRMTAASVADTRLLLTLQFPPDKETGEKVRAFVQKELAQGMIVLPSIALAEFVKIAGVRIGIQAAANFINVLKERGMKIRSVDEEVALEAGKMRVRHKNVPFADSLIATFASSKIAEYALSDDPHFQILGSKTKWF